MAVANVFEVEVLDGEVYVKVHHEEFERLEKDSEWLSCLKEAGVDNWEGIEEAHKIYNQRREEEI